MILEQLHCSYGLLRYLLGEPCNRGDCLECANYRAPSFLVTALADATSIVFGGPEIRLSLSASWLYVCRTLQLEKGLQSLMITEAKYEQDFKALIGKRDKREADKLESVNHNYQQVATLINDNFVQSSSFAASLSLDIKVCVVAESLDCRVTFISLQACKIPSG